MIETNMGKISNRYGLTAGIFGRRTQFNKMVQGIIPFSGMKIRGAIEAADKTLM
jgi:hypothetical protein